MSSEQYLPFDMNPERNPVFDDYLNRISSDDREGFVGFMSQYESVDLALTPTSKRPGVLYVRHGFDAHTSTYISVDYDDTMAGTLPMRVSRNAKMQSVFHQLQIEGSVKEQDKFVASAHKFCSPGGIHNHIDLMYVLSHLTQMQHEVGRLRSGVGDDSKCSPYSLKLLSSIWTR